MLAPTPQTGVDARRAPRGRVRRARSRRGGRVAAREAAAGSRRHQTSHTHSRASSPARATTTRSTRAGASEGDAHHQHRRACVVYDVSDRLTPYDEAWAWQKALLSRALDAGEDSVDAALIVQHPPTITLGTGSTVDHLKFDADAPPDGFAVRRCERGGEATYHGPGQLVVYPILNLARSPHQADLHWYMRSLEAVALGAMRELGLDASACGRIEGLTGAWCDGHKLAAVGVRARRWVSYHGVALNVCPNLAHFAHIVPCGIDDRPVGSVSQMLRGEAGVVSRSDGASTSAASVRASRDDDDELLSRARDALIASFVETFDLDVEISTSAPEL